MFRTDTRVIGFVAIPSAICVRSSEPVGPLVGREAHPESKMAKGSRKERPRSTEE
jgi:hypothetical protein